MSALQIRPYAERLATARPNRFKISTRLPYVVGSEWMFEDLNTTDTLFYPCSEEELWNFIRHLAIEFRINGDNITEQEKQPDGRYLSLPEALLSAICQKVEEAL